MNIQDTISDLLVIINNGQKSKKKKVSVIYSKININILKIFKKENFINFFYIFNKYKIKVILKYFNNLPIIQKIIRISKPSLRIYYNVKKIKDINYNDLGIYIISTSSGIITHKIAKIKNIGGEVICYIS